MADVMEDTIFVLSRLLRADNLSAAARGFNGSQDGVDSSPSRPRDDVTGLNLRQILLKACARQAAREYRLTEPGRKRACNPVSRPHSYFTFRLAGRSVWGVG